MDVDKKERRGFKNHRSLAWIHVICNNIDFNYQAVSNMLSISNSWWMNNWLQILEMIWVFQNPDMIFTVMVQENKGPTVYKNFICIMYLLIHTKKIMFDSKWKQNEKWPGWVNVSLQLCYLGPFSSHLFSNSTSPPLKEKKKTSKARWKKRVHFGTLLLFQWWRHCPSQSNVFWKSWP